VNPAAEGSPNGSHKKCLVYKAYYSVVNLVNLVTLISKDSKNPLLSAAGAEGERELRGKVWGLKVHRFTGSQNPVLYSFH
jgi:hypothetical protein